MEQIGYFVTRRAAWARLCVLALAIAIGVTAAGFASRDWQENHLAQFQIKADRHAHEIMAGTISDALMGAISVTGLTDDEIKSEGMSRTEPNTPKIRRLFDTIGQAFNAEGVFVVSSDGIIRASWNADDKPTTGLNVRFRPYFQVAMKGGSTIYAAVRLAREDRCLYFSAPIFPDAARSGQIVGAIVARTSLKRVDDILNSSAQIALLLSPQGIVFAGNRQDWIGRLVVAPTPERLKAIRELKQFGDIFEARNPIALSIPTSSGISEFEGTNYVVSASRVRWNDPSGDWQLLLMNDLSLSQPQAKILSIGLISGGIAGTIALLLLTLLRSLHRQNLANLQVRELASAQEIHAEQKERIASLSLRLQQTRNIEELGEIVLGEAHHLLDMQQGVIYTLDTDGSAGLQLIASYACASQPQSRIAPGEGLLGQCAVDQHPVILDTTPTRASEALLDTRWRLHSGLGDTPPGYVAIHPITLNNTLVGVIEIALIRPLNARQQAALEAMLPVLAMNLEISRQYRSSEERVAEAASAIRASERSEDRTLFQRERLDYVRQIRALQSALDALARTTNPAAPPPTASESPS